MSTSADVIFEILNGPHGSVGLITLNRPNQLNALNQAMFIAMREHLHAWATDDTVKAVVIRGAGERAFCAGGDIRYVYEHREQLEKNQAFFIEEYSYDREIFHFSKPYIAFLDGITFGGGAGVSINGKFRIATEKFKFSMPETGIGFFTDVGSSYFLSRLPNHVGIYLALTGAVLEAPEAFDLNLVNAFVPSEKLSHVLEALVQTDWSGDLNLAAENAIKKFSITTQLPTDLHNHEAEINHCFAQPTVEKILAALASQKTDWAQQTLEILDKRSPTSLKVVLEQLQRGRNMSFDDCIQMEFRLAVHFLKTADFYEGIRAAVIYKDRHPHWSPATLAEVSDKNIADFFAPLDKELNYGH